MRKKGFVQVVVCAVIYEKGKILLTKRIQLDGTDKESFHGAWQLPGGGLEFGETPEQAVVRECKEELGVEVEVIDFIPHISTEIRDHWQGVFLNYMCRIKDRKEKIVLNEEASEYRWFTLDEAKSLRLLPGLDDFFDFLEVYLKHYER